VREHGRVLEPVLGRLEILALQAGHPGRDEHDLGRRMLGDLERLDDAAAKHDVAGAGLERNRRLAGARDCDRWIALSSECGVSRPRRSASSGRARVKRARSIP
jgi:hypothetical protein